MWNPDGEVERPKEIKKNYWVKATSLDYHFMKSLGAKWFSEFLHWKVYAPTDETLKLLKRKKIKFRIAAD